MISFPNAKINLGLNIVSKRPDGYHNIESCFYPVPLKDALEIIESDQFQFTTSGLEIPGSSDHNLCTKAYQLLKERFNIPPVHIHLHKVIPMGAGLGGGSADGAFTLKMLNEKFDLKLSTCELQDLAGKLGSDCPFFIENKPVYVTDTGTTFSPVVLSLAGKFIAIKHPGIHVGTKEAYAGVTPKSSQISIPELISRPITEWKEVLKNDFEDSIFTSYPAIKEIKDLLYHLGAVYASMSGSGSAVFGIFEDYPVDLQGFSVFALD